MTAPPTDEELRKLVDAELSVYWPVDFLLRRLTSQAARERVLHRLSERFLEYPCPIGEPSPWPECDPEKAGERRVLSRLSAKVRDLLPAMGVEKRPGALCVLSLIEVQLAVRVDPSTLESLRDAPAGEERWQDGDLDESAFIPVKFVDGVGLVEDRDGEAPFDDEDAYLSGQRPRRGKEHCAEALALLDDPPAKPEAAGEEPATPDDMLRAPERTDIDLHGEPFVVSTLREMLKQPIPVGKFARFIFAINREEDRLAALAWLDRPAPAAREAGERHCPGCWDPSRYAAEECPGIATTEPLTPSERAAEEEVIRSFFYESGASYVIDTKPWTSEERLHCLNSALETFRKYRNEHQGLISDAVTWQGRALDNGFDRQTGLAGQLVTARREVRELREERDRLRARVAELKAERAAKG